MKLRNRIVSGKIHVDMTPMIDCVFQLMIFFIVTFKLDADMINEKIELAQSPHGPAIEEKVPGTMIIEVDHRGIVTMGRIRLNDSQLFALVKTAALWPRIVEQAAEAREPHRIAFYLGDLAAAFHSQWNMGNDDATRRFVRADSPALTAARLALADAVGQVIRNGLSVMGVEAADELH